MYPGFLNEGGQDLKIFESSQVFEPSQIFEPDDLIKMTWHIIRVRHVNSEDTVCS